MSCRLMHLAHALVLTAGGWVVLPPVLTRTDKLESMHQSKASQEI